MCLVMELLFLDIILSCFYFNYYLTVFISMFLHFIVLLFYFYIFCFNFYFCILFYYYFVLLSHCFYLFLCISLSYYISYVTLDHKTSHQFFETEIFQIFF